MNHPICRACETVSHCSKRGCIPITPEPEPAPVAGARLKRFLDRLLCRNHGPHGPIPFGNIPNGAPGDGGPFDDGPLYGGPPAYLPIPLKFPEIDESLLDAKETTA